MKITPFKKVGPCLTGNLSNVTVDEINRILGFDPNCEEDSAKVKHSWGFKVDGQHCGIWDYKGSEQFNSFSTYGPASIFVKLFGGQRYRTI